MTEQLRAILSLTRADLRGAVYDNLPHGIPLIDHMTDEELAVYLSGEAVKTMLGLPGSEFVAEDNVIGDNMREFRMNKLFSLYMDVQYASERERPIPDEVVEFLSLAHSIT